MVRDVAAAATSNGEGKRGELKEALHALPQGAAGKVAEQAAGQVARGRGLNGASQPAG